MIMKRISIIITTLILLSVSGCNRRYEKYRSEFIGLFDSTAVIIGYAKSEAEFNRYAESIYNRAKELDKLYSIYEEYDDVNNLFTVNKNAGIAPVEVSRDIIDLLLIAKEGYNFTGGEVNVSMGAVLKIWHDYRIYGKNNPDMAELPPMYALNEAVDLTDIDDLIIDEVNNTVFLQKSGMSLDVGAVAKGYAAELAVKAAKEAGMKSAIINFGGNISTIGKPFDNVRDRWGVGIQDPNLTIDGVQNIIDTVYVNDMTVSCSGMYQRYYTVDGKSYNHIIDSNTLMPADRYKTVAVIHPQSGIADLLSTALFILPMEEGMAMAEKMGAEALWIHLDDSQNATEGYIKLSKNWGSYSAVD